ncbi:hypothetical protein SLEP1_g36178 [Rubroshorea leprosula]|uniref:XRE family transcriptional regulator n=1 Tax=Rubroshorea leprosula TaxID=152421 RepID=A0AAV5KQX5_9ROSI|nr:hypothetical protein SLEP1_g36178 [Rubroshorea leprosula]
MIMVSRQIRNICFDYGIKAEFKHLKVSVSNFENIITKQIGKRIDVAHLSNYCKKQNTCPTKHYL